MIIFIFIGFYPIATVYPKTWFLCIINGNLCVFYAFLCQKLPKKVLKNAIGWHTACSLWQLLRVLCMKKDKKRTVEHCLVIDIGSLARANILSNDCHGTWVWRDDDNAVTSSAEYQHNQGIFTLRFASNDQNKVQNIRISTTPCNYGNHRYWFTCPGENCGRRIAKIYFVDGQFLCRHCHKLNYLIQQCSKRYVAQINMQRMRIKLGWPLDCDQVPFIKKIHKPLNKNHKTFRAMVDKHDEYERQHNATTMALYNAFIDRLDRFKES
ncbi:hypothetical protein BJF94_06750 [Acinetobacter radioresistens]|nr:hypothetical protein BJF94_06750 [Acinetobacter radioresistens]